MGTAEEHFLVQDSNFLSKTVLESFEFLGLSLLLSSLLLPSLIAQFHRKYQILSYRKLQPKMYFILFPVETQGRRYSARVPQMVGKGTGVFWTLAMLSPQILDAPYAPSVKCTQNLSHS